MTSPLAEHAAHMAACVARLRRREDPRLEHMPPEACMAVSPRDDLECHYEDGHTGAHSWQVEREWI